MAHILGQSPQSYHSVVLGCSQEKKSQKSQKEARDNRTLMDVHSARKSILVYLIPDRFSFWWCFNPLSHPFPQQPDRNHVAEAATKMQIIFVTP